LLAFLRLDIMTLTLCGWTLGDHQLACVEEWNPLGGRTCMFDGVRPLPVFDTGVWPKLKRIRYSWMKLAMICECEGLKLTHQLSFGRLQCTRWERFCGMEWCDWLTWWCQPFRNCATTTDDLCFMNTFFQHRDWHKNTLCRASLVKWSFRDSCIVGADLFQFVLDVCVKRVQKFLQITTSRTTM